VAGADLDAIKNRKSRKPSLNLEDFERAVSVLDGYDLVWFDFARFTGMRKDEANRARWDDIEWTSRTNDNGRILVRGTKTEESAAWIPLAPVLRDELLNFYQNRPSDEFIFPGRSYQTKGKKIYSRRRLFEKITRLTSFNAFMERNPGIPALKAWKKLKSEGYPGGVKLKPKDLRDYFASEVASQVNDPSVVMKLLRHTSLNTTTKYLRVVEERMHDAVKNLGVLSGANRGGQFGANLFHSLPDFSNCEVVEEGGLSDENIREKIGGGGRSRTCDAADMSRVL
jgi:integrase